MTIKTTTLRKISAVLLCLTIPVLVVMFTLGYIAVFMSSSTMTSAAFLTLLLALVLVLSGLMFGDAADNREHRERMAKMQADIDSAWGE